MSNDLLILSASDVERCLDMTACIDAMRGALIDASSGAATNPLRSIVRPDGDAPGILGLMPAIRGGAEWTYGLKEVCVFPGNHALGVDSHQGSVLLHEGRTGRLVAVLNGSAVTAIRTAAVTAVASAALARSDRSVLALVGAGFQARWHLEALATVHDLAEIRVVSARPESAEAFARQWASTHPIRPVATVAEAVDGADVVTTVTNAAEPVVRHEWLAEGTHVNAVGSSVSNRRELDTATIGAARLFVDRRESTLNEAGDYLLARVEDPSIGPDSIVAEVGAVLAGDDPGRLSPTELTVFKSLGLAVEDVAAAQVAVAAAARLGLGTRVPFD